jgi:hypothetical protein
MVGSIGRSRLMSYLSIANGKYVLSDAKAKQANKRTRSIARKGKF